MSGHVAFPRLSRGDTLSHRFLNSHSRELERINRLLVDLSEGIGDGLDQEPEAPVLPDLVLSEQSRQTATIEITDSSGNTHDSEPVTQVVFTDQTGRMWTLNWTPV